MFEELRSLPLQALWQQRQLTPPVAMLERLRRTLCTARHGTVPRRPTERQLVRGRQCAHCRAVAVRGRTRRRPATSLCRAARRRPAGPAGLGGAARQLRDNPPPHTHAVSRFNTAEQPDAVPVLGSHPDSARRTHSQRRARCRQGFISGRTAASANRSPRQRRVRAGGRTASLFTNANSSNAPKGR